MTPHALSELIRERCNFTYARSGGPGGQNVNKVATKAVARLPLSSLSFLTPEGRAVIETRLANRINAEGEIVVAVQDTREQARNREIAVERMSELISMALRKPRKRVKTRPSRASREARLRGKKLRSTIKQGRRSSLDD
jgi:ribosome-associated protein